MSDEHHDIAMRMGTGCAVIVEQYLPKVIETVKITDQPVSFGMTLTFRRDKSGVVRGSLRTRPPKIPQPPVEQMDFVLELNQAEQLQFLFAGTPEQMKMAEIAHGHAPQAQLPATQQPVAKPPELAPDGRPKVAAWRGTPEQMAALEAAESGTPAIPDAGLGGDNAIVG